MTYGMTTDQAQQMLSQQIYGNQQAMLTGLRSSYGDSVAQMAMGGSVITGGVSSGFNRMFSDLGKMINPVSYTAPARVETGFYGEYAQQQGFFSSMMGSMGLVKNKSSANRLEQIESTTSDFASRLAGGATYLGSTAAMLAGGAALAPAAGIAGGAMGSAFGPAGAVAGKLAGGMLGGFLVAGAATDAVMDAVQSRRQIQDYLGETSFRYVGAGSDMVDTREGKGMSRSARREVSALVRKLDIGDPSLNTEDLTSILKGADQAGLFTGAGANIDEFKDKFKKIVEDVKIVSKTLKQSLSDGLQTMKELKGVGIEGSEVRSAISFSQTMGLASGRTAAEMVGLGLQGANLYRGTGVDMGVGFAGAQMNLTSVRAARDAQILSQEAISQAGGEEALAMRMTASGLQFAQSSTGRGFGAGFFNAGAGGLDANQFMNTAFQGGGDFMQNYNRSINNLSSPGNIIKYQVNQEKFMGEVGEKFGGTGLQMMQNMYAASESDMLRRLVPGVSKEDAFKFSLRNQGLSATEIEARMSSIKGADKTFEAGLNAAYRTRDEKIVEEALVNNDVMRFGERVKDLSKEVLDKAAAPVNKLMDDMESGIKDYYEENFFGIRRASFSNIDVEALSGAGSRASGVSGKVDLDKGGLLAQTQGEALFDLITSGVLGKTTKGVLERNKDSDVIIKRDGAILGMGGDDTQGISKDTLQNIVKESQRVHTAMVQASELQKKGELKDVVKDISGSFDQALVSGKINERMDIGELVKAVTGKEISDVDSKVISAISLRAEKLGGLGDSMKKSRDLLSGGLNANQSMTVEQMSELQNQFSDIKDQIGDKIGFDVENGFVEQLSVSASLSRKAAALKRKAKGLPVEQQGALLKEATILEGRARSAQASAIQSQADASGADPAVIASKTSKFLASSEGKGILDESAALGMSMANLQAQRGSSTLGQALDVDIRASGLEGDDLLRVRGISDAISVGDTASRKNALLGLSSSDKELLNKAGGVGVILAEQSDLLKGIKDSGSKEDVKKILDNSSIAGDNTKIASIMDSFNAKNTDAAVSKAYNVFQGALASDSLTSSANAGGAAATESGSSQEDLARTVQVQVHTLHAMEALAKRLGLVN